MASEGSDEPAHRHGITRAVNAQCKRKIKYMMKVYRKSKQQNLLHVPPKDTRAQSGQHLCYSLSRKCKNENVITKLVTC